MSLTLLQGPGEEPVSLSEAKAYLRVDGAEEDALIGALITSARMMVESSCGKALLTQSWMWRADAWPRPTFRLPLGPLQSVEEVALLDADGGRHVIAAENYQVLKGLPGRLLKRRGFVLPARPRAEDAFEISFTAGYGPAGSGVPALLQRAVLMLTAHWYENREPVAFGGAAPLPLSLEAMLASFKEMRL